MPVRVDHDLVTLRKVNARDGVGPALEPPANRRFVGGRLVAPFDAGLRRLRLDDVAVR